MAQISQPVELGHQNLSFKKSHNESIFSWLKDNDILSRSQAILCNINMGLLKLRIEHAVSFCMASDLRARRWQMKEGRGGS